MLPTSRLSEKPVTPSNGVFKVVLAIKGLDGVIEILGGVLLALAKPTTIYGLIDWVTARELAEDPQDSIAPFVLSSAHHLLTNTRTFAIMYLLLHGIIKLGLVVAVLRRRVRLYPWAMFLLTFFVVYQLYRYGHTHSPALLATSVFDILVIYLIGREWYHLQEDEKLLQTGNQPSVGGE